MELGRPGIAGRTEVCVVVTAVVAKRAARVAAIGSDSREIYSDLGCYLMGHGILRSKPTRPDALDDLA